MKFKKVSFLFFIIILLSGFAYSPQKNINLKCLSAVVIDQDSGRILYSKNENSLLPMASTTKIMTAIVAIERGNLKDTVTISSRASSIKGSVVGYKKDEKLSLEELLYGLMMRSGNDAAIAIAEHISGSVEEFSKLMTDKAFEIGAYDTSFKSPHGLDMENHYTTAKDLAKITAYAMKNETFAKISSTKEIDSGESGKFTRSYNNINKFLYQYPNSDGVKTGSTGKAGKCFVASVKNPYGRYICVVLNSSDRWNDAKKLADYAEKNYKYIKILSRDELIKSFKVYGGEKKYIAGKIEKDLYIPVTEDEINSIKMEVYAPSVIFSPVKENEILGNVVVYAKDTAVGKYPIISDMEVKRKNFAENLKEMMKRMANIK
ncbi:D-alanyl-D-alanine carboxypeptidase (penicillin-binding protein 5/6) [Caloramator quimbayensis]|uniref:serine-type D-Ala-D-Ala carboxypeptidase n=1 Tax=Caloramator quimbayensis TaxID=1147123 RepID=A0A1T4WY64_9CLOT|nr:D-alanyl-D-alanine carboxypeptidase family protein [Caloramator quimbayensis]SKA82292.1 D-alanyl-D-alanine carboxypeptidase (penicillin-binding protein 5/6) [Caloramator quimbayensis]